MQTITTRYAGPTNTKGSRIIAKCWLKSKATPWDYSLSVKDNHKKAAEELLHAINAKRSVDGYADYQWSIVASGEYGKHCEGYAFIIDLQASE